MENLKMDIISEFENVCNVNEELVKENGDDLIPILITLSTDRPNKIFAIPFKDYEEKQKVKEIIWKLLLNTPGLEGYIMIVAAKITLIDKLNTNKYEIKDAIIRTLYSPKKKYVDILIHEDKKIVDRWNKEEVNRAEDSDDFDIWGKKVDMDNVIIDKYNKIKEDNKEEYKRCT